MNTTTEHDLREALQNLLRDYIRVQMASGLDERDVASLSVVTDAMKALERDA